LIGDGKSGLFDISLSGSLFIDSSTIDPLASKALHQKASERGFQFLDAPVSGGVTGAATGKLTFMVGGDAVTLDRAQVTTITITEILSTRY
jgi:3-hydroxyisobutyrate dehydrogenase-like beta-hydroxyacid dehydrogenase